MGPHSYAPSESAIEVAVERRIGSAGFFQRVAEQLARGVYPDLADSLVPFGRRSDDKTIRGWPDAYLTKSNGSLIAIEATTAGDAATDHWQADLSKLATRLPPERRGGLIWVAWCDPAKPTDAIEMREQASQLGLPADDILIVFRKDLCARLRAPFHARFWINDLGLKPTSGPFSRVQDVIRRLNFRQTPSIFPTAREYEEQLVYAPPVLNDIEKTLAEHRAAVVAGHGAAGKTTLAMVLAHRPRFRHAPVYYLDLTGALVDLTLAERAAEALVAIGDRQVLFIIDNAHLDPGITVRLFQQWETYGDRSELLILTRRIRAKVDALDGEPDLEAIPSRCFDLVIEPADLAGIYVRHYRTRHGSEPNRLPCRRKFSSDGKSYSEAI